MDLKHEHRQARSHIDIKGRRCTSWRRFKWLPFQQLCMDCLFSSLCAPVCPFVLFLWHLSVFKTNHSH